MLRIFAGLALAVAGTALVVFYSAHPEIAAWWRIKDLTTAAEAMGLLGIINGAFLVALDRKEPEEELYY